MPGTYISSISSNGKIFAMYRAATVVLNGLTPNDRNLADTPMEWMGDALGGLIVTSTTSGLVATGTDGFDGTHSMSASMVAKLSHVNNWQALFDYFGSGTNVILDFMERMVNDWADRGYTASVYHVYDIHGADVYLSFIVNGVAGIESALPM
ncbi:hypothetical protein DL95DRAFT_456470 [Leptodontidium sp. 2 PMI_412]|nr:hypothetical protein DL95DRAFT_456470 [Leptodontidium sp. 2 PMI_412]